MGLRLLTSLNWLVGTLAIGVAILLPFYREMQVQTSKAELENAVGRIVVAERWLFDHGRSSLAYFRYNQLDALQRELKLNPPLSNDNFSYEVYGDESNVLVVRSITSQSAQGSGRLPMLMYVYKAAQVEDLPSEDQYTVGGEWLKLSGRKAGLLALAGF